jgi:hypothetical protein
MRLGIARRCGNLPPTLSILLVGTVKPPRPVGAKLNTIGIMHGPSQMVEAKPTTDPLYDLFNSRFIGRIEGQGRIGFIEPADERTGEPKLAWAEKLVYRPK